MQVEIVTAGEHFLYLPLYYAATEDVNFFGCIPSRYQITINGGALKAGGRKQRTDQEAVDLLLDSDYSGNRTKLFAVCDPTALSIDEPPAISGDGPAVVASLITNTAFWAVDHRQTPVPTLAQLAKFDQILAWDKGTTSHRIASHISSLAKAGKKPLVETVSMGKEIDTLRERSEGTLAISPDIMLIEDLVANNPDFRVLYALGNSPEYSNVLVTAIITLRSVAESHSDLVRGLLQALQRSVLLTRSLDKRVISYAKQRFQNDEEAIERALSRANESHVFPVSLEVDRSRWLNAFKLSLAANNKKLTASREARSVLLFDQYVTPYAGLARDVYQQTVVAPLDKPSLPQKAPSFLQQVLAAGLGGSLGVLFTFTLMSNELSNHHWSLGFVSLILLIGAVVQRELLSGDRLGSIIHWSSCMLTIVCAVLSPFFFPDISASTRLAFVLTFLSIEASVLTSIRRATKRE